MLTLKGHEHGQSVRGLAFAADSAGLLSWGQHRCLNWWNLATLRAQRLPTEEHYLESAALSRDGTRLACGYSSAIVLANLTEDRWRSLPARGGPQRVQFAPDGHTLASGAGEVLRLWDMTASRQRATWNCRPWGTCTALAFSPDGQTLATGHGRHDEPSICLWDAATRHERSRLRLPAGWGPTSLAFAPDGRTLAAACGMELRVWNVADGKILLTHWASERDYTGVAFTPDGRHLAATHADRMLRVWRTQSWSLEAAIDWKIGPLTALAFAADGMLAACGSQRGKIVLWDVDW